MQVETFIKIFLPSSFVVSTTIELFGPSPLELNANTWNSYPVYASSPLTTLARLVTLLVSTVGEPAESFFL